VVRLAELEPFEGARPLADGELLHDLFIMGGTLGTGPLYVDDIWIVDLPAPPAPPVP
jgi:hypothetical protein